MKSADEIKDILTSITKDFYGANYYGEEEANAAFNVVINQSPFRYYGNHCLHETEKFEQNLRKYFGVKYAHCVNSATGALLCALHALDVTIGDEVLVPGYFWVSVANAVLLRGAFPVLCEVDDTFNIDVKDLEKKITSRTKCLILIHMDGVAANIGEIIKVCSAHKIKILEDFSQCIGGCYRGKKIGTFGEIAVASLQVNKIITSGEGGVILTNSKNLYNKVIARSDIGSLRINSREEACYEQYTTYGEGRRYNEICAAIMNVQLKKLNKIIRRTKEIKKEIKSALGNISPIRYRNIPDETGEIATTLLLIFPSKEAVDVFWNIYSREFQKKELKIYKLNEFGCHVYYNCANLVAKSDVLPGGWPWDLASREYCYRRGTLPNTDGLLARTIGLKLPGGLSEIQTKTIIVALKMLINRYQEMIEVK